MVFRPTIGRLLTLALPCAALALSSLGCTVPEAPEDEPDERFVEACHKLEYVEYLNDLLLMSDQEERTDTVKELLTDGTIARMQTRLDEQKKEVRCHVREQEIA